MRRRSSLDAVRRMPLPLFLVPMGLAGLAAWPAGVYGVLGESAA
jgi:hypothetical protein